VKLKERLTRRPHCFTIREILVLVGTVEAEQRAAYLNTVFGWFFDRTRSTAVAASAALVTLSIAVASAAGSGQIIAIVSCVGLACVIGSILWINFVLVPLHREYLACLALLKRVTCFERELKVYLDHYSPEPEVYVMWIRRVGWWGKDAVEEAMLEADKLHDPSALLPKDIGRYLVDTLASLPTDGYLSHPAVRAAVHQRLRDASDIKAGRKPQPRES
jgi:hypothetical protein